MPSQVIDVVIPVFNEEAKLEGCITALVQFLDAHYPGRYRVTVADNGSTDRTPDVARRLCRQWPQVHSVRIPEKGRGRALRAAWLGSPADVLAYMDVDLSTDLTAFPYLIAPLLQGRADLATGTRLHPESRVRRRSHREVLSRGYNGLIHLLFPGRRFTDAQCGFKAVTRAAAQTLVPEVRDNAWFFDTELLLLAETRGFRVDEVPVTWVEGKDSHVRIPRTVWEDVKGLIRVRMRRV